MSAASIERRCPGDHDPQEPAHPERYAGKMQGLGRNRRERIDCSGMTDRTADQDVTLTNLP